MIIKNGLYNEFYCDKCHAFLEKDEGFLQFRNHYFCTIDCWEKHLLKNCEFTLESNQVFFDEEYYNSLEHLYTECLDEIIQR